MSEEKSGYYLDKKTNTIKCGYQPQPKQALLHGAKVKQILYGGAVGGGKSHGLRFDAYQFCLENPNLRAYLFRKNLPDLRRNHIDYIRDEIPLEIGVIKTSDNSLVFSNGSILYFCYCERESDLQRYQGAEMHWLGIDEATQFTPFMLTFLRTRVRLGGYQRICKQLDFLPRIIYATNPQGGPGHGWIKRIFIDHSPMGNVIFYDPTTKMPKSKRNPKGRPGYKSLYIPSRMDDNKYLDEDYESSLQALPPSLRKALAEGDWDVVVGAALHNLSRKKHMIREFTKIAHRETRHWTHLMSLDWGTASPFSVGWYMICDGGMIIPAKDGFKEMFVPDGAIIRYDEWYGWDGRENSGLRLDSIAVAKGIKRIEKEKNMPVMDYRIADSQCWGMSDGPTVASKMYATGIPLRQCKKDRAACYEELVSRLAGNESYSRDGRIEEYPMFFVTENCRQWWRTVPSLILDTADPDKGPAKKPSQEDHTYDETVYLLRSQTFVSTEEDRWMDKHGDEYNKALGKSMDPYSTG